MTYKVLGVFIVALGVLGIALPVLPTTPFLLLALWFFGRSSERLREWVLDNRIFGSYIRAYRSGRGLPVRMKVWTLVLLWTAIGISVWRVDPVWLKCLLGVVAVAVTIHILCLGRRRTVVLVPTLGEAAHIAGATICGVGMAETAAALARVLSRRPRLVVLAGIAGAYPRSGLAVGDCVVVATERVTGMPQQYHKVYECPYVALTTLRKAAGVTVNGVGTGEEVEAGGLPVVENMEGAAFFAACAAAGVAFLEVRAVSNLTTDRREDWQPAAAAHALSEALKQIFDEIEA